MDRSRGLAISMCDGALGPHIDNISPSSGGLLSALLITFTGYGFSGGNISIGFGGTASLLVVILSDNLATAVLPGLVGVGNKSVQISTDLGTSNAVNFNATLT